MPSWRDVLDEVQSARDDHIQKADSTLDLVRRKYLNQLSQHTGRNVIAYYSGFLSKPEVQSEINDEDKNGFMMAVYGLDRHRGLDLILHTPGGQIGATQSLVNYLHKMFGRDIRALVPQIAMSAGTMIACSCKSIGMTKHSNLGPIDPHLRGIPAYGVLKEFETACREVKQDPSKIAIWQAIIGRYHPSFLGQCANSIEMSSRFVKEQLESFMFMGTEDAGPRAERVVKALNDLGKDETHERHIHAEECEALGLQVESIEADAELQDLLLTVHHCYMHSLMNTPAFKIIENQLGAAFVKQQVQPPRSALH